MDIEVVEGEVVEDNEEGSTEDFDNEVNDVATKEDVEEAIPEGAKPIPVTTMNTWPSSVNTFERIGSRRMEKMEKYLQDASHAARFALLEWTQCQISTATQEISTKMTMMPSTRKNL